MSCNIKELFTRKEQPRSSSQTYGEEFELKDLTEKSPAQFKIRMLQASNDDRKPNVESNNDQSLQRINSNLSTLNRFGPLYGKDVLSDQSASKKQAWLHLVESTPGQDESELTNAYTVAIRRIQDEAIESYDRLPEIKMSEFREMMVKDGCFFLQLALRILGGPEPLGYSQNHVIFGARDFKHHIKIWSRAMFFVGNQIPVVVLQELMKQSFFQQVIASGKWDPPSSFSKRILYELFVLPSLETIEPKKGDLIFGFRSFKRGGMRNASLEHSCDVIQALRSLVLGPEPVRDESGDEFDLEENWWNNSSVNDERKMTIRATKLRQKGIKIKKLKNGVGSRKISFRETFFGAYLYLPTITVTVDTEIVLTSLKNYEMNQPSISKHQREVCSYIHFMSEIIRTPKDVQLLSDEGVIEGTQQYRDKLPGILRRIDCDEVDEHLHLIKVQICDYSGPEWQGKLWSLFSLVALLTLVQTFYTVLGYYHPRIKSDKSN